jgi:ABC-type phosphate/phosphonate transport system substrate-binding protein
MPLAAEYKSMLPRNPRCSGNGSLWVVAALFLLFEAIFLPAASVAQPKFIFRIGLSAEMFTEVNENDARAAMRAWGLTVARDRNIPVEPDPKVFRDHREMLAALQKKELDVLAISTVGYDFLRRKVPFGSIFIVRVGGQLTEEYLLVAHRSGPVKSLKDLAGRHVQLSREVRLCLAPIWLDTLLLKQGLEPLESFAGRITRTDRISQTLLPVFFRQVDACIVTRRGFETMVELNPQIGQQLAVIESSPPLVPAVFAFRADYAPPCLDDLREGVSNLHNTAAGRQVLLVFNSDRIEEQPLSLLEPALELLKTHTRLSKGKVSP